MYALIKIEKISGKWDGINAECVKNFWGYIFTSPVCFEVGLEA